MSPLLDTIHTSLGLEQPLNVWKLSLAFAGLYLVVSFSAAVYSAFFGPLSKFPGPKTMALSKIPRIITLYQGTETTVFPALHRKYGPVVRIAPGELCYAAGAQASKDIDGFKKAGAPKIFKDMWAYQKPMNKVAALITADDATHSRQRKLVSHAFAEKSLQDLEPMLKEWCAKMVTKFTEEAMAGREVDMVKFYNCTTFDIMGDLAFNEGLNLLESGEYSSWVKAMFLGIKSIVLLRCVKYAGPVGDWLVESVLMRSDSILRKQVEHWNNTKDKVDRRLARNPERADLWSKILEKGSGPDGLSRDEHHSLGDLFMVAGTETTATALSGTTYWLLQNPQYLKTLTAEIREAHVNHDSITLASVAKLKYLHAVLQEGLRMYPPVPTNLLRKTPPSGAVICGEMVPGNTTVGVHQFSTARNEENFKRAYEFHPERWLGDAEFKDDHLDALEPFSTGPRNCLGKNLAWHEMRLILASTLFHFDLELCEESLGWNEQKSYVLWEKTPLICKLTPVQQR